LTPKCNSELTLDPKVALARKSELMLLRAMLQSDSKTGTRDEFDKVELIQDEALSVAPLDGLTNMLQHVLALSFK
jgi:PI-3-kinase-related kinase SMG-1